jgi:formylglycine-generating enzyme required for sulfatase activity
MPGGLSASLPLAHGARLPTEEEWEYACRAGTQTRFWCGDEEADLDRVAWYAQNSGNRTHRVGEKPANAWGLYDVQGNVWEWTLSEWTSDYSGREAGFEADPAGVEGPDLAATDAAGHAIRGGSYVNGARSTRLAYRGGSDPGFGFLDQGFRVFLPAPEGI